MKGFMNPIFKPVDYDIPVEIRRNIEVPKENFNSPENLPKEYEKIFSSITDLSQQLGDSFLQPFDNSKFMHLLAQQEQQNEQVDSYHQDQCSQQIVKLDRNRLLHILKILANQQQNLTKKTQKEQQNQVENKPKISEKSQQPPKIQIFKMNKLTKNDTSPKNISTTIQKINDNESKSPKQRSSTNYTPRVETQKNSINLHSYKNIDALLKKDQNDKSQKRASSEYFEKYIAKFQIDKLNEKIKQAKNSLITDIKEANQLTAVQNLVDRIVAQNFNLEKLRLDAVLLQEFKLPQNQKLPGQVFQKLEKLKAFVEEKLKKLQTQFLSFVESPHDTQEKKQPNVLLSRQTTSDNILDELNDDKKKFYALVVNLKLELPYNHPGKNLLLCELFNKAQKLGIKKSNWDSFIKNEMKF